MAKDKYSFIATADVHLFSKLFNLPELAEDLKDKFVQIINKALELAPDYLIIVGDLYDINRPPPDLVNFVQEQVDRLKTEGIVPIGIAGDHDKPINGIAWIYLSGIYPINHRDNRGRFLGYDYNDNSASNIELLKEGSPTVEWIFLHGQVPELFSFCEDKKLLDLKNIDLIKLFPALKGVILGDIHTPLEGAIHDPAMKRDDIYIGYCGSPGMVKSDEIDTKLGLLYFDGDKLERLPVPLDRDFIRIEISKLLAPAERLDDFYFNKYRNYKGKKPVMLLEYDRSTKPLLPNIERLRDIMIIREVIKRKDDNHQEEVINLRSELKTGNRTEQVLRGMTADNEVFDLISGLISSDDPRNMLDEFKLEKLQ